MTIVVGLDQTGRPLTVADEDACLVFGTPRSGKTRGIVIPSVLAHQGPCVITSSKYDVMEATLEVRAADGPVWVFSTDGRVPRTKGANVRLATWTPIPQCTSFDKALLHARAMVGAVIGGESLGESKFWYVHSERLLAALMHAAALAGANLAHVAGWVLSGDLAQPIEVLRAHASGWAMAVVDSVNGAHDRFRDSVLATTTEVLRVFDHSTARWLAAQEPFPIEEFLTSNGTLYICVSSEEHELFAPLVVGLIEDIIRTKFARATGRHKESTLALFLDELRRIAPIHNLPGYLAEAGSHGVQILGVLQDLSQARERWGSHVAEGFLTLFRAKVLLPGILDRMLLENLSQLLGEEMWGTSTGTVAVRPRWTPHTLSSPEAGHAIYIDRSVAVTVRLHRLPW